METLLANLGAIRRETLNGVDYLVAPASLIVEGVLSGSRGPLYYPADEIGRDPMAWNGMPIVMYHPTDHQGRPTSARSAKVLAEWGLGNVYEAVHNGKLSAEAWFEVNAVKRIDARLKQKNPLFPEVFPRLERGQPIELSTGLFTDNEPTKGTYNGRAYDFIARNYRPDHLAILPDQIGACSVNDGCGISVNADRKSIWQKLGDLLGVTNSNPEGINQYTVGQMVTTKIMLGSVPPKESKVTGRVTSIKGDQVEIKTQAHGYHVVHHSKVSPVGNQEATDNAGVYGNPQHGDTGQFLPHGTGTGKGPTFSEAKKGYEGACPTCGKSMSDCECEEDEAGMTAEAIDGATEDTPTSVSALNAFCATGEGGGQDNSCGGEGGGGSGEDYKSFGHLTNSQLKKEYVKASKQLRKSMDIAWEKHGSSVGAADLINLEGPKSDLSKLSSKVNLIRYEAKERRGISLNMTNSLEGEDMNRDQMITFLTTNCDCWKGKDKVLQNKETFTDDDLKKIVNTTKLNQLTANTLNEIAKKAGAPSDIAINAMPAFIQEKIDAKKGKTTEDDPDDDEDDDDEDAPTKNQRPMTLEQWEATMPEAAKPIWNAAKSIETSTRKGLTKRLKVMVENERNPARKRRMTKLLENKASSLDDLQEAVEMFAPVGNVRQDDEPAPMFMGASGGGDVVTNDDQETDIPDPPVVNYDEFCSPRLAQRLKNNVQTVN